LTNTRIIGILNNMAAPARNKKRVRNPALTRLKLLQATIDLIADAGPAALSLKEATRRAQLSRGVAYHHFRDRDHLLSEAKSWISGQLAQAVRQMDAAPMQRRTASGAMIVLNHRNAARVLIAGALAGKDFTIRHPLYKLTRKMLKEFLASGDARKDVDLEVLIHIMLGTLATILMFGETHKRADNNELAERFAAEWSRILARGIFRVPR
jgi:AcrR family transcriptional regulator